MTAATVTRYIQTANPTMEVVVLTATDGESFTSRKFKSVLAAMATSNEITSILTSVPVIEVDPNSSVVTVNWQNQTDQLLTVQLWGN